MTKKNLIKLHRYLCGLFDYIVLNFLMNLPSKIIRKLVCKMLFKKLGRNCFIAMGVEFMNPKNISIGENTVINKGVLLDGRGAPLIIGSNVDVARDVHIWTLQHDINDDNHCTIGGQVLIKNHVWIGSRTTILPNTVINKGAVIASGSVVTKDVPENEVVGGIPAKTLKKRRNQLFYKLNYQPYFK